MSIKKLPITLQKWIFVSFIGLFLFFLYEIRGVLGPFIVSLILVYVLAPVVDFITNLDVPKIKRFSRGFAVTFIYIIIIFSIFFIGEMMLPRLYHELLKIGHELPMHFKTLRTELMSQWLGGLQNFLNENKIALDLNNAIDESFGSILKTSEIKLMELPSIVPKLISGIFNAITTFIIIFIFTAFVLVDLPKIQNTISSLILKPWRSELAALVKSINRDLSGTIRGQLLICLVNGILTTLGLLLLKIKYAITIGIIAGVFSLIPIFGAIISTIPAVLIALTQSWIVAIQVIVVIILIHLLEANYLNPKIMGHNVELHPTIIIFALIVGEHFFGIAGLLLSVPTVAMIRSILIHFYVKFFDVDYKPE